MEQPTLDFNPEFNGKKMSPQCQKLYDRLLEGPITNASIRDDLRLLEYRRRFKDLRDIYGIPIKKERLGKGLNLYSLDN